jgi:hypothetical protein
MRDIDYLPSSESHMDERENSSPHLPFALTTRCLFHEEEDVTDHDVVVLITRNRAPLFTLAKLNLSRSPAGT